MNKKIIISMISIAVLMIIVIVASVGMMMFIFKVIDNPDNTYVGGIKLGLKDNNISEIEEILNENLPVSYTVEKSRFGRMDYTVIPSSEFNSLKETIYENENINIIAVKQEDGDTYALLHLFGEDRDATNTTKKLQKRLDKYSLEVNKTNWKYVTFSKDVQYKEIKHIISLLENESNVIGVFPDFIEG